MIRIAIIDDHAIVRMGLKFAISLDDGLELAGEKDDGENAAAFVATVNPDVTLLDIRMDGVGGLEALEAIMSANPESKVIMLTTSDSDEDIYRAINLGARGYVIKDRDAEAIPKAVRTVVQGGKWFPEAVLARYRERQMTQGLTNREREVLQLASKGLTNIDIAQHLGLAPETVKLHLKHCFAKLGVANRTECVVAAKERGFIK